MIVTKLIVNSGRSYQKVNCNPVSEKVWIFKNIGLTRKRRDRVNLSGEPNSNKLVLLLKLKERQDGMKKQEGETRVAMLISSTVI